ncbi:HAMP domain-containing histidine kinase [Bizionia argentinensis JUB59]|uniref:histidine kinase n=1 Tax=Bizionia argentinensis JUB59 TaxID=1046627 RepID=G2EAH9_9FLAO|nr:HAMP domain-containing sensor histidine kinase [Bizionia argentinensis]EGV44564.1 HAMP domain-containing histidine kinase [Bizionia argentinensis JUB59]
MKPEIEKLEEASRFKTELLSLISHDFKDVFGSLLLMTEAVENSTISKDDFFNLLPKINQDAKKNLQTLSDTGEWLRTQMDDFEPKKSNIFVLELFTALQKDFKDKLNEKKLDFLFKGDENIVFQNDNFLISYILKKILDNAIKYSFLEKTIYFEVFENINTITLSIVDFGMGMDLETQKLLFSFEGPVFHGTREEIGAGLSLKIAKKFVTFVHGELEVDSTENVGTTISIILSKIEK